MRYTLARNLGIFAIMSVVFAIITGVSGLGASLNILELLAVGFASSCAFWLPLRVAWSTLFSDGLLMAILAVAFGLLFEAGIYILFGALFGDTVAVVLIVLLFISTFFFL